MKLESLKTEKFKELDSGQMKATRGGHEQTTGAGSLIGMPGGGTRIASSDTLIWDDNGKGLLSVSFVDAKTGLEVSYKV